MSDPKFAKIVELLSSDKVEEAETLCRQAVQISPNDVNMNALLGGILLKTGRLKEAEFILQNTIKIAPKYAKPHLDLGILYMHQKRFKMAEWMFRRATEVKPEAKTAWLGLAHSLKALGRKDEADEAGKQALALSPLVKKLERAETHRLQGEMAEAGKLCAEVLEKEKDNILAMRLLARISTEDGHLPEAEQLWRRLVELTPESAEPVTDLARFCAKHNDHDEAVELFKQSIELDSSNPATHLALANILFTTGMPEHALDAYEATLALDAGHASAKVGRAHALRMLGRNDEVVDAYLQCIDDDVNACEAYWSLSSLRTHSFSDADVERMRTLRKSGDLADVDQVYLDFALGKALDDRECFDEAWKHYSSGNSLRRTQLNYDGPKFESGVDTIINTIDQHMLARALPGDVHAVKPIFILGMPRSGSTLLEQILASHSRVEGTTELPFMAGIGERHLATSPDNPTPSLTSLSGKHLMTLAEHYLSSAESHRAEGCEYFIDKEPDNFLYVGLIALLLPNALVIDARRGPMDTCVGNFRQLFGNGKEFSYELHELGHHYLQYLRIMQHWDEILPGKVLRVQYEDLIENTEAEIRRMLEFCGLEFEDDCLNYHESDRVVTTASSEQVRQPMYKSAVGFWKNYQSHLDELIGVLQPG